jgi:hypothetical protein
MRKLLFSALALSGLFFASCNSDKCKDKVCGNGTCNIVTGACDCKSGYEADVNGACNTESRTKFIASAWTVNDTLQSTTSRTDLYTSSVSAGATAPDILITNLFNSGWGPVKATIDAGGKTFTVASQNPITGNTKIAVSGKGTYVSTTRFTLSYTIVSTDPASAGTTNWKATFKK